MDQVKYIANKTLLGMHGRKSVIELAKQKGNFLLLDKKLRRIVAGAGKTECRPCKKDHSHMTAIVTKVHFEITACSQPARSLSLNPHEIKTWPTTYFPWQQLYTQNFHFRWARAPEVVWGCWHC